MIEAVLGLGCLCWKWPQQTVLLKMAWDSAFRFAVCLGAFASWALSFLLGFLFVTHDGWLGLNFPIHL